MLEPRVTARYFVAYGALALLLHEFHEMAHTATARVICGAWGVRDFNVWRLAEGCSSVVPTMMGPLFSYLVMYSGIVLMRNTRLRMIGVALALAPNPCARLFTAVMGGGDEGVLARALLNSGRTPAVRLTVLLAVAALSLPPMAAAWRALHEQRRRLAVFITLLLAPMVLTGVLYFWAGNRMLAAGILAEQGVFGAPLLLELTTLAATVMTLLTMRWLRGGAAPARRHATEAEYAGGTV